MPRRIKARISIGSRFKSGFEERFANDLDLRGVEYEYEPQAFTFVVKHKYKPDFRPKKAKKNGMPMYIETKGYFTPGDRAKTLRVLSEHPDLDLRFVFMNAQNKIGGASKQTYGGWCEKHGIPYATGTIPEAWLDE